MGYESKNHAVLVFRGTNPKERTKEGNEVARRFLKKYKNKICEVSGHSLGGTLALQATIYNDFDGGVVFNPGAAPIVFRSLNPWYWSKIKGWQGKTAKIDVIRSNGDTISWNNILGTVLSFANPFDEDSAG